MAPAPSKAATNYDVVVIAATLENSMREIAGIRIPDSKLAVAALDLVKIESHASIYKHVLRTFVFGGLAARAEGIGFDEALPRDNFKKVFVDALFSRVQKDPPSVALTWMSEAARRHVHGFECPDFVDLVSAANFAE